MRRLPPQRDFPPEATITTHDDVQAVVGTWEWNGKPIAKAYSGKRNTPDFYYNYPNVEVRAQRIELYLTGLKRSMESKAARRDLRKLLVNPVKAGDVFYASWGWEQTNIDFYRVIEVQGQFAIIREVQAVSHSFEGGNGMADYVTASNVPIPGREPIRKRICTRDGGKSVYLSIDSVRTAYVWDGQKKYRSWYA